MANDIIDKRYNPSSWNVYLFQCSDGDNFADDNNAFIEEAKKITAISQLYGYCEIEPDISWIADPGKLYQLLRPLQSNKLKEVRIQKREEVWPAFMNLMSGVSTAND